MGSNYRYTLKNLINVLMVGFLIFSWCVHAQTNNSQGVERQTDKGCKFVDYSYLSASFTKSTSLSLAQWSGECLNGYVHGFGTLISKSLKDQKQLFTTTYYREGLKNGDGEEIVISPHQKSFFQGRWKDGLPLYGAFDLEMKNGKGFSYQGPFKEGKFEGQGELIFKNGPRYIGEFKEGFFNGQGELTWQGASYVRGPLSGKLDPKTLSSPFRAFGYTGFFLNGKIYQLAFQ